MSKTNEQKKSFRIDFNFRIILWKCLGQEQMSIKIPRDMVELKKDCSGKEACKGMQSSLSLCLYLSQSELRQLNLVNIVV